MIVEENVPLASYTTFGIGGPARFFVSAHTAEEVTEALSFATQGQMQTLLLGGGSNILVPDAGFDGVVIKIEIPGIEINRDGEKTLLIAGAGESWDAAVEKAVSEGLWGMENLSGVPGTVGGAVSGNIGAYGQALSQTLAWVEVLDTHTKEIKRFTNAGCAFGYRESIFTKHAGVYVIIRAAYALVGAPQPDLSYKDLAERFKDEKNPSLLAIREAVLDIRADKFPDLSVEGTAGSFFKNPIVTKEAADALVAQYPGLPVFAMPETAGVKVPLAWLLDRVLSLKGHTVGGARLFEKQPLVIAAQKGTSSADVVELMQFVIKVVEEKFSIGVEPEVKIIS